MSSAAESGVQVTLNIQHHGTPQRFCANAGVLNTCSPQSPRHLHTLNFHLIYLLNRKTEAFALTSLHSDKT